ncbi:MAG: A/G-specific adenine glycosylase [candidate division KSB1 bacterium]|nr:A/G-specific adenine glycosylase [candidate division KSB1 bacterium]MDZ7317523.1 A/G-specific adenine glycosylase [candidate division KSB1 bacterium]MDZ7340916.1 A/G-specific adenine glycosylase [candidate division KSB1 bacterium]
MTTKERLEIQQQLIAWFEQNQRRLPWRTTQDPYRIWVAEVMLQQTQVKTVLDYYDRFLDQFPDLPSLAKAPVQQVLKLWEGLGYYARARNLHRAAQIILAEKQGQIPTDTAQFLTLPGVGDYMAAAVLSQAFNAPLAAVDGNVKRVLARLFALEIPVNQSASGKIFKEQAEWLLDHARPGAFNQAMMELGATICRPKRPECDKCPIRSFCQAFLSQRQTELPIKTSTRSIPEYHIAVGVIYNHGKLLVVRRKNDGLLGGMWEFPGGRIRHPEDAADACVRTIKEKLNLDVIVTAFLLQVRHAYSHFKIVVHVFQCAYQHGTIMLNGPEEYRWISMAEIDQYPFHGVNHKFIPLLKATFTR